MCIQILNGKKPAFGGDSHLYTGSSARSREFRERAGQSHLRLLAFPLLTDIIVITLCAVIRGAEDWTEIVRFGESISLDGKTLRISSPKASGKAAIHWVSAWSSANQGVLGQTLDDGKSNEIPAIPRLPELIEISGSFNCRWLVPGPGFQKSASGALMAGLDFLLDRGYAMGSVTISQGEPG